jgi:anti-sigma-K factor RskA
MDNLIDFQSYKAKKAEEERKDKERRMLWHALGLAMAITVAISIILGSLE